MDAISHTVSHWLGLESQAKDLTSVQMGLRALVIMVSALVMLRVAHKRFFARRNALDVLLTLVIASTLARAINGQAAFFPTIVTGFVLVFTHRALTWASVRHHGFGWLLKGSPTALIENGEVNEATLRKHDLSRHDLDEDLRLKGTLNAAEVSHAILERNGEISVVKSQS